MTGTSPRPVTHLVEAFIALAIVVTALASVVTDRRDGGIDGPPLDGRDLALAFDETFQQRPSFWDPVTNPGGRWKTSYWFGVQDAAAPRGWEPRTLVPNRELQYYGDPARGMSAFEWQPGVLTIAARPNRFADDPVTHGLPYLSGLITTEKSFAQRYGYFEARVAFPSAKGIWPAFWLLPLPAKKDGKPQPPGTTEIDVFESIGEPGRLHFTSFPDLPGDRKEGDTLALQTNLDLSDFHTYGVLVTPRLLAWYVDGRQVRRAANRDYHRPLYMLLNLAIGGKWPGPPAPDTRWPARMRIDWVRAYRWKGQ